MSSPGTDEPTEALDQKMGPKSQMLAFSLPLPLPFLSEISLLS